MRLADGSDLDLQSVTFIANQSPGDGGALSAGSNSSLTARDVVFEDNLATSGSGGAIAGFGDIELLVASFDGNRASQGGAIVLGGSGRVSQVLFHDNRATASGGAVMTLGGTDLAIENATFSANVAPDGAAIDHTAGALEAISVTFAGHATPAIDVSGAGATMTLGTGLVAGECSVTGTLTSLGYNLESPGDTCGFASVGDQVAVTALALGLGPLADNGGATLSHDMADDSAARDAGSLSLCPTRDQRGVPRDIGNDCDVGAIEKGYCATPGVSIPDSDLNGIDSAIEVPLDRRVVGAMLFIEITHPLMGDLRIRLTRGSESIQLLDRPPGNGGFCSGNDLRVIIDDDAPAGRWLNTNCRDDEAGTGAFPEPRYRGGDGTEGLLRSLTRFGNESSTWTLNVADAASGDLGTLNRWCVFPDHVLFADGYEAPPP